MAASSCSGVQSGASVRTEPVAGLTTSKVASVGAASPAMVMVGAFTAPVSPTAVCICSPAVPDGAERRDIDLLDGGFYVSDPYPTYAWMREHAPLYWDATNELWGVSRYDDVVEVETRKDALHQRRPHQGRLPAQPPG